MVNVPTVSFNSGSVPVPPERPTRFARGTGMCFGIEGDLTPSVNQWLDFPMRIPVSAGFRSAPMGLRRWRWVGVGEIPDSHRWDSSPKIRFAPDSPLEVSPART